MTGDIDCDPDGDGILNDLDGDGTHGDEVPCTGGNKTDCVDNCQYDYNPGQEDTDGDGVGNACDGCPAIFNARPPCVFSLDAVDPANHDYPCKFAGGRCRFDRETMQGFCSGQQDTDRDRVPDACDLCPYDYDPSNSNVVGSGGDACHDTDGDGLSDLEEIRAGIYGYRSDPFLIDTDGDGLSDYEEVTGWSDPMTGEVFTTNPENADTDGDGCPDPDDIPSSTLCDPVAPPRIHGKPPGAGRPEFAPPRGNPFDEPPRGKPFDKKFKESSRSPVDELPKPPRYWAIKINELGFTWEAKNDNFAIVGGLDANLSQSEMIVGPVDPDIGASGCMATNIYDQPFQYGYARSFDCKKKVYNDECVVDCNWIDTSQAVVLPDMICAGALTADGQAWAFGLGMGPGFGAVEEKYRIRYSQDPICGQAPKEKTEKLLYEYFGAGAIENPDMPIHFSGLYRFAYPVPMNLLCNGDVIEDLAFQFTEENDDGDTWVIGSVTLTPLGAEISDTPCDWLPVGGDESGDEQNDLTYQVRLLPETVGGQPLQAKLRVEVTERTSYVGYAMNASYNDGTDEDPDLVCPSSTLADWTCEEGETPDFKPALIFKTKDIVQGGQVLELKVKSRDYAAYGKIAAYLDTYAGPGLGLSPPFGPLYSRGWVEDRPRSEAWTTIPIDRGETEGLEGNKMADQGWAVRVKGEAISWVDDEHEPGVDEDTNPVGDGTQGDGLIALNEYRGFMVQEEHIRTHTDLKDVFVIVEKVGDISASKDELLSYARNLAYAPIHRILEWERAHTSHQVNYNKTEVEGERDQCGVMMIVQKQIIKDYENVYGVTKIIGGQADEPSVPCKVDASYVSRDRIALDFEAEYGPASVDQIVLSTVAHELGHGMRMPHWLFLLSLEEGGPWSVMINFGGIPVPPEIMDRFANETPSEYDIVMDMPHFLLYE